MAVAPLRRHLAAPVHAGPTRGRRARQPRPPRAAQRHRGHQAGALGEHPTGPAPRGAPRPRPGRRAARTARMGPGPLVTPTSDEARLPPLPVVGCRSCEPGLPTPTSAGTLGFSQPGGGGRCAPRLRGCGFRRGWRRRRCCRHSCEPPGRRTPPQVINRNPGWSRLPYTASVGNASFGNVCTRLTRNTAVLPSARTTVTSAPGTRSRRP